MELEYIKIKGAKQNNLKDISLKIPRNKFIVITGLSGSGKSSLAFDTIYAEGQRRYVESLSSYARQFLGQMDKPEVDMIEGLSPAISIDQKTSIRNPRSTVGTVTEIYDYLRLLYSKIGIPHCPKCGKEISAQSIDQIVDSIFKLYPEGTKLRIMSPVVRGRKGEYHKIIAQARKDGYVRVRIDGEDIDLQENTEEIRLEKQIKHNIEIVVDRLVVRESSMSRLSESISTAMDMAEGYVLIDAVDIEEKIFCQHYTCPDCGISVEEMTPRMFSFNNPYGACPTCTGLGTMQRFDEKLIAPNWDLSLSEGAIAVTGWNMSSEEKYTSSLLSSVGEEYGFDLYTPLKDMTDEQRNIVFYGTKEKKKYKVNYSYYHEGEFYAKFEGIINGIERRYNETKNLAMKEYYEEFMTFDDCPECKGMRLREDVLAVTVGGKNIHEVTVMPVGDMRDFFDNLELTEKEKIIAERILKEIHERTTFLVDVGLDYLNLARAAGTLSGGEAQRIRLATQIGSGLTGVLYILDEPSIGLHQRDNQKLIRTLKKLRDLGNTLIVVEHDEETILESDYVVDIGPGAGIHGGEIVAQGTVEQILASKKSATGQYLSGTKKVEFPSERRPGTGKELVVYGAKENNLKNVDVHIPLGKWICVTGVSGSGKSSLVNEILSKELLRVLNGARKRAGKFDRIEGLENLDKVIVIDQSPIGRTPRSNPATYTGLFDLIRAAFASTPDAKMRGYQNGRFSFNVKGGRCEACKGDGIVKIEMHFLPDVYVPCDVCKGKRYNRETLEVKYKGKTIADVLDMTVEEGLEFFKNIPKIARKLQTLFDVGLGYIKIGQPSTTLSGGEAQRVKLATELSKRGTGKTMYILDEPTTGLHIADVHRLVNILHRLVDAGNTVMVIEHNMDIIKNADHIIDLGPEGGVKGGTIVATGTPEEVSKSKKSYTGKFLKNMLQW